VGLHNGTPEFLGMVEIAMAALISKGLRHTKERGPLLLGRDLQDEREEMFVRMVCDGLPLGSAYARAGFTSKTKDAAYMLFDLPRVQARAKAILEARRTTGVVTLAEVTDMLQRVFAGAHAKEEYSAAHNAAFSLARLYGHVTDKATLEVIRRPSRDPDAPSEQALSSWVESLPALPAPGPDAPGFGASGPGPGALVDGDLVRAAYAPAPLLGDTGPEPQAQSPSNINGLDPSGPDDRCSATVGPGPSGPELFNDIKGLDWTGTGVVGGRPENGAPARPVTGTPEPRAHSGLLAEAGPGGPGPTPIKKTGPQSQNKQVPVPERGKIKYPPMEDLF
jgi:hypothetical protein